MRSVMIGTQFAISAFMLALVAIVYMQNEKVKESSYEFPRSEIYTLDRLNIDTIRESFDTLRHELEALPAVKFLFPIRGARPGVQAQLWCTAAHADRREAQEQVQKTTSRTTMTRTSRTKTSPATTTKTSPRTTRTEG